MKGTSRQRCAPAGSWAADVWTAHRTRRVPPTCLSHPGRSLCRLRHGLREVCLPFSETWRHIVVSSCSCLRPSATNQSG